jgi:class 3 adenylate cyclase
VANAGLVIGRLPSVGDTGGTPDDPAYAFFGSDRLGNLHRELGLGPAFRAVFRRFGQTVSVVTDPPETRYAETEKGVHIAYQVLGDGPLDLMLLPQGATHLELAWELPSYARVFRRLASFSRLIRFDMRGSGLSDPFDLAELPSLEEQAAEMLAVLDVVDSEHAAVVANGLGGLLAVFFAATYPNRTSSLVLDGCAARQAQAPDYPWGVPNSVLEQAVASMGDAEGGMETLRLVAPNAARDHEFSSQYQRYSRSVNSPAARRALATLFVFADVRPALSAVQAPTLVLYRRDDQLVRKPHAEYLAAHIPGATLIELPGDENLIFAGDSDADLDEIEEFLTGIRHSPETDRVLATVLFTDIVGSTERAAQLGDRAWRGLLDSHDRAVRRQLERFRGREVKAVGDGFVATFDGPGRAIQCACAIREAVHALELEVRTGVHTGEIEMRAGDVAGIAVHLAQRVSAVARPGEVLVSRTVTDLVAGSGFHFDDRGEHELKGVPETWHLYAVVT